MEKKKKATLSERVANMESAISRIESAIKDLGQSEIKLQSRAKCDHDLIRITIERDSGWIWEGSESAVCEECGKVFERKHTGYINRWAIRKINRAYGL